MVFNSVAFLIFFVVFFFAYWVINSKGSIHVRNLFIIAASYLFYGWWDWRFLSLIIISSAIDYLVCYLLSLKKHEKHRKWLLVISLAANIGILGYFKYYNFFIESLIGLLATFGLQQNYSTLSIILPVGISFYTFQTLSYTIDVYRRRMEPTRNALAFFAFVSFFPQLVAGPIERASHLLHQFFTRKVFSYTLCVSGLRLILWGLFKKIAIADNFGLLSDRVFQGDPTSSGLSVAVGAIFFALQIYTDFSGYSDIAIGTSKMLGFDLMTNFRTPYFSASFGEFWQRWHISLSSWFRDYVYIPLGGSKKGSIRTYANLFITFMLSALWHGANVTFLIWGGLHAFALMVEKSIKIKQIRFLSSALVLSCVVLFWIPFRAENFHHLIALSTALLDFEHYNPVHLSRVVSGFSLYRFYGLLMVTGLFLLMEYLMGGRDFDGWIGVQSKTLRISVYYLLIFVLLFTGNFSVKPDFIYFQF